MEDMSLYAEKRQIKKLLHEYLSRVVSAKPDEPLAFLIESIRTDPYVPGPLPPHAAELAAEAHAERARVLKGAKLDLRRPRTKTELLRAIFDQFEPAPSDAGGCVSKPKLLVALKANPTILLEAFPAHATMLPGVIEDMPVNADGLLEWPTLRDKALQFLAEPGR